MAALCVDALLYRMRALRCPKIFAAIVLMIMWTPTINLTQEFDVLEFYAGNGNLSRYCKLANLRTGSLDIMYEMQSGRYSSNAMDILSPSGFALAVAAILKCCRPHFLGMFAMKCSSFTSINKGTSNRAPCSSVGFDGYESVCYSNGLLERTVLLLILVTILDGTWCLEQPGNSCLEFYPVFRAFITALFECQGDSAVYRTQWWMAHYGGKTPKRHYGYANSPSIQSLDKGRLVGWKKRDKALKVETAVQYKDRSGRLRYKGTKQLKKTEEYPLQFGREIVDLFDLLAGSSRGAPPLPTTGLPPATASFLELPDDEPSAGLSYAALQPVYEYLRRGKHLVIPDE